MVVFDICDEKLADKPGISKFGSDIVQVIEKLGNVTESQSEKSWRSIKMRTCHFGTIGRCSVNL